MQRSTFHHHTATHHCHFEHKILQFDQCGTELLPSNHQLDFDCHSQQPQTHVLLPNPLLFARLLPSAVLVSTIPCFFSSLRKILIGCVLYWLRKSELLLLAMMHDDGALVEFVGDKKKTLIVNNFKSQFHHGIGQQQQAI
jgi:hypothetical protein